MSRGLLIALGGGLLGAILFLSERAGTPGALTFALLTPLPLFAVGLMQGWTAALVATGVACAAVIVTAGGLGLLTFLLRSVGPVLIVVRQGLLSRPGAQPGSVEWYPPGLLLAWLTAYGLLVLVGATAWYMGQEGGLEGLVRSHLEAVLSALVAEPVDPRLRAVFDVMPRYLPGGMIAMWLLVAIVNGVLAQATLARAGHARRPTPAFAALALPPWLAVLLALVVLCTMLPGQIGTFGRNGTLVMSLPYFLLGLAVVHTLARNLAARAFVMFMFYLLVVLFIWPAGLFVVILGIIEQWFPLRRRFAPQGKNPEDE